MVRNIQTIAEHSVDLSLLRRDSNVMDCGCRNFQFAKAIGEYVDYVICIDADPEVRQLNPAPHRFGFLNRAITTDKFEEKSDAFATKLLIKHGNGTGSYIDDGRPRPDSYSEIPVLTTRIDELHHKDTIVRLWDLIKLDIEGAEIDVLLSLQGPISRQLSVEFHLHTGTPEAKVKQVFAHLGQWYDMVHCDYSDKHGCGINYWDVLFIWKYANL
jgi:FkbM family methyltransferase